MAANTQDIADIGQVIDDVPVRINYNLINLFSGQLYSTPIKAIEELVVNSYDAFAHNCVISVPHSIQGRVWVWDDGESMDLQGLKDLWLVAESTKREGTREKSAERRGRLPIGRFGIGKLASYVLGRRITHLCRKDGQYLAVTMDYGVLNKSSAEQVLTLKARRLTEEETRGTLADIEGQQYDKAKIDLFSKTSTSWTVVVVDRLKQTLESGRLQWVLSTALPLIPDFKVFWNGSEVIPNKAKIPKLRTWRIGKEDEIADKLKFKTGHDPTKVPPRDYYVELPKYGRISGQFELYSEQLDTGKAAEIGFSNGFFVLVRNRLINTYDNRFGITNIPYLGFNRMRAEVHADFLDRYLTASREDLTDEQAKEALKDYLHEGYNTVRNYYVKHIEKESKKETAEEHLKYIPGTLLTFPLRQAVERIVSENAEGFSIRQSPGEPPVPVIKTIEAQRTDVNEPLATLERGTLFVNTNHPFYQSVADYPGINKLVIAEILLEAYMLDAGIEPSTVKDILSKRDRLLRSLVNEFPESAVAVSKSIRESVTSQRQLETSCIDGFRVLGFDAVHLGKSGKPDGVANANLGFSVKDRTNRSYTVTIDAKSTQDEAVQSGNLGLATVSRHRREWKAQYSVVIAPDFQAGKGEDSKAVKEALEQEVCLIRAADFASLVAASSTKPLSLENLRSLFELRSPLDTAKWIDSFTKEMPSSPPLRKILDTIWIMQQKDPNDPPQVGAVKYAEPSLGSFSNMEIKEWLQALSRLVPDLVVVEGEMVQLNQTPAAVAKQAAKVLADLPASIKATSIAVALKAPQK